jgi:drug/metabolite transporter (DMT)-like permease
MKLLVVWWITCLIWSSVWLFIKIGVTDLPPISFAGIRLLIALAVLIPIRVIRRAPLPARSDWPLIATTGWLLLGINYACTYWGAQFVSSGLIAVLQAATPAFGLCFGHYLLRDEPFSFRKLAVLPSASPAWPSSVWIACMSAVRPDWQVQWRWRRAARRSRWGTSS